MRPFRETMTRLGVEVVSVNDADVGREGAFLIGFRNYYFTVDGPCPLAVAEALYATPVGRTDIRAGGNGTCPEPRTQATYYDADCNELVSDPGDRQAAQWDEAIASGNGLGVVLSTLPRPRFVPDAAAVASRAVVKAFHVDSELGLYMLLQALRADAKGPPCQACGGTRIIERPVQYDVGGFACDGPVPCEACRPDDVPEEEKL